MQREWVRLWPNLMCILGICLEELRITRKSCRDLSFYAQIRTWEIPTRISRVTFSGKKVVLVFIQISFLEEFETLEYMNRAKYQMKLIV
jgi:hypothetical protein